MSIAGGVELFFFYLFGAASPLSIAALNLSFGVLLLMAIWKAARDRPRPSAPAVALLLFFGWNLLSSVMSPHQHLAMKGMRDYWPWLAFMAGAFVSSGAREKFGKFLDFLGISISLTLLPSLAAFLFGTNLRLHRLTLLSGSGRAPGSGFFSHHLTYAGAVSVAGLLFAAALLTKWPEAKWRRTFFVFCAAAGLVLSGARSYILGFVPGAVIVLLSRGKRWLWAASLLLLLPVAAALLGPAEIRAKFASPFSKANASNVERYYLLKSGFQMVAERPVFGWGPSTYIEASRPYKAPYAKEIHYPKHEGFQTVSHCHNAYLQLAIDSGVVGLLLYLAFVALSLRSVWRQGDPVARWGVLAAWAAFLVGGLFEFNVGDAELATLAFFLLGFAAAREEKTV